MHVCVCVYVCMHVCVHARVCMCVNGSHHGHTSLWPKFKTLGTLHSAPNLKRLLLTDLWQNPFSRDSTTYNVCLMCRMLHVPIIATQTQDALIPTRIHINNYFSAKCCGPKIGSSGDGRGGGEYTQQTTIFFSLFSFSLFTLFNLKFKVFQI